MKATSDNMSGRMIGPKRSAVVLLLGLVSVSLPSVGLIAAESPVAFTAASAGRKPLSDLSLKELLDVQFDTVSTASRRRQWISEAPASVSIVTREEIKSFGYRTLADALGSTPGVYTTDDRYYTYLGLRGFSRPGDYNSRVLLLIDGSRANDNVYDSGWIGQESPADVDNIERVEVIRGPASSLYGSSAFFGTINVISRRGGSLNGVEAFYERGTFSTYKGRLAAGYKLKSGLEFFVAASYYDTRGQERLYYPEFDAPETNHGVAENLDYQRASHFTANASYRGFTLSGGFNSRTRGIPTGSYDVVFNDPHSQTKDISGYVDLKFEHEFPSGLQLMARVGYHRYDYHGIYPWDFASPGDPALIVLNFDSARGDWRGAEATVSRKFSEHVILTGGAEVRDNFRQEQLSYYDTSPADVLVDSRVSDVVLGVYGQADWTLASELIFSAGVRYDHYSTFGGALNPRFGVIWQPWETTTAKLLYGRAFRAPNAYESSYIGVGQNPNPDLRPETIGTYEAVLEHAVSKAVKLTASASYYRVNGLIAFDYSPGVDSFQNMDRAETFSGELGVEGRWTNGWFGRLSYTAQRAEDGNGLELDNSPRHLAKAHVRVPLLKDRLFFGVELQRIGSAKAVQSGRVDAAWFANATLFGRKIVEGVEISASVYNLFNQQVGNTGFDEHRQRILDQNGRSFRVRLAYRF